VSVVLELQGADWGDVMWMKSIPCITSHAPRDRRRRRASGPPSGTSGVPRTSARAQATIQTHGTGIVSIALGESTCKLKNVAACVVITV
jgi:hypothetical protein